MCQRLASLDDKMVAYINFTQWSILAEKGQEAEKITETEEASAIEAVEGAKVTPKRGKIVFPRTSGSVVIVVETAVAVAI